MSNLGTPVVAERDFHGMKLSFETGKVAKQASGAVIVRSGDSCVLVTAVVGGDRGGDFLPLTIDYVEKTYAAGKIPGGFFKREGRLTERETLISRFIDRPCRPLFPEGFHYEVQVVATVLSADPSSDTDVLALCGASTALSLSEAPFEGPIAGVRVARIKGDVKINPPAAELENADLNFIVAGTRDAIVMVEGGAGEASEEEVLEALFYAHQELQAIIAMQDELVAKVGKPKMEFVPRKPSEEIKKGMHALVSADVLKAVQISDKLERRDAISSLKKACMEKFAPAESENAAECAADVEQLFEDMLYHTVRNFVFDTGSRIDGRDTKTVRPIAIEVGYLPRVHGSSLFTRGETQAIVTATLGVDQDAQRIDGLFGAKTKSFMLHYNFPPFSVGEARPMRGPGRREIGHGALAERALQQVLPANKDFPYVLRIVSEITESNGSSSMATVCGGSLALMDAGVPIKAPVAGVAMGLMKDGEKVAILTDILGDEDHLGDMDFKVCGTENGITALQMDIKIKGLDKQTMSRALSQARDGRLHILSKMKETIASSRKDVSQFAPRIESFKISTDKIRDLIGPGGKVIKGIQEAWEVKINIEDSGNVTVSGSDPEKLRAAVELCKSLTEKPEIGKIYNGIVKRIADFGAFVEIIPGVDGLVHISQLANERVNRVEDIVSEGDQVVVKVLEIDRMGKIRLSIKEVDESELASMASGA